MKLNSHLSLMCTCLLLSSACIAAEQTATRALSLDECVSIAMRSQINVLTGRNAVLSAQSRRTQAESGYYPQVGVDNRNTLAHSASGNQSNTTILTATQNFYDGGLREANVSVARAGLAQSAYALKRTAQTVTYNVTQDYFALLRARHLLVVRDSQLNYLEEQLRVVRGRIEEEDAAKVDALPVEAQLANARVDQLSAQNAVQSAGVQLQNTMGLIPAQDFEVQEYDKPTTFDLKDMNVYVQAAIGSRPDILQDLAAVGASRASLKSARIDLYPRPFVSGQYDNTLTGGNSNSFGGGAPSTAMVIAGVTLNLFDGFSTRASYRQAEISLSDAQIRAAQVLKDAAADVQKAYLNLISAQKRVAASELSLAAAQKNFDAQEERYRLGVAIVLDLLNAQSAVVTAQSNAVQSRYDYYTSLAQLEFAIGKEGVI